MLYLFDMRWFSAKYIVLFIIILILICFLWFVKRRRGCYNDKIISLSVVICSFLIVVLLMIAIVSYFGLIHLMYCYKNNKYSIAEGEVKQFQYIYANNSVSVIGATFAIDNMEFEIGNDLFSSGYSVRSNIINRNGQVLKIYYCDKNTIVRIDSLNPVQHESINIVKIVESE